MTKRLVFFCLSMLLGIVLSISPAYCQEPETGKVDYNGIADLIDLLIDKGVITKDEGGCFIERYRSKTQEQQEKTESILPAEREKEFIERVEENVNQDIQDEVEHRVKKELKPIKAQQEELGKRIPIAAEWTKRIRWGGDARLRYQGDFFDGANADLLDPAAPTEVLNTHQQRHRARYRVRLAMKADVTDTVELGFRITTGNEEDPVSTNETLGDSFANDGIVFDRAYLKWMPNPMVTAWGGRMPNPWFHSDLVWDPDLNFEGVALNLDRSLFGPLSGFFTAGGFPLQEVEFSTRDKWLYGAQAGLRYVPSDKWVGTLGVAYYDYENIEGEVNDPLLPGELDFTAPRFQQKGNTLIDIDPSGDILTALAADYNELNVTGTLDIGIFHPIHIVLLGDYVKNIGFDKQKVAERIGLDGIEQTQGDSEQTKGYQLGLTFGYPEMDKARNWQLFFFYKYLEPDAVVDAFTESDFHLGGTNAEGWILGGEFALAPNLWLKMRWLTANEIVGPPLAIDVWQIDLKTEF